MTPDRGRGVESFGVLADGRTVRRFTLGEEDGLQLRVLDYGAAVQELWVPDRQGRRANVVLGAPDLAGYTKVPSDFFGAVIGRCANRIDRARIRVAGVEHRLVPNEGQLTLHGGPEGFHRRLWTVEEHTTHSLTLGLISPDGDQGFPGELTAHVHYALGDAQVSIDYSATTTAATVVNLTNHAHFNLAGESSGSIDHHLLSIDADRFTPVRSDMIPLGPLTEVADTALDLRIPTLIQRARTARDRQIRVAHGLDHNYVLAASGGRPAAVLSDPTSGRVLEVFTDQPGLQVYSGNFFDGTHRGTGGALYDVAAGVALETQAFPDAAHHQDQPGWPSVVLRPGDVYRSRTRWRLGTSSR